MGTAQALAYNSCPLFCQGTGEWLDRTRRGEAEGLGGTHWSEVQTWPWDSAGFLHFAFISQMQTAFRVLDLEGGPLLNGQGCSLWRGGESSAQPGGWGWGEAAVGGGSKLGYSQV